MVSPYGLNKWLYFGLASALSDSNVNYTHTFQLISRAASVLLRLLSLQTADMFSSDLKVPCYEHFQLLIFHFGGADLHS